MAIGEFGGFGISSPTVFGEPVQPQAMGTSWLPNIARGLGVGGGLLSIYGTYAMAAAKTRALKGATETALFNSRLSQRFSEIDGYLTQQATQRMIGSQLAHFAKNNLSLRGSPLLVMEDTQYQGSFQEEVDKMRADVASIGFEKQASDFLEQARDVRKSVNIQATQKGVEMGYRLIKSIY